MPATEYASDAPGVSPDVLREHAAKERTAFINDLGSAIPGLCVTRNQRELIKAAVRTMIAVATEKRAPGTGL